jgi:hypothetical protein
MHDQSSVGAFGGGWFPGCANHRLRNQGEGMKKRHMVERIAAEEETVKLVADAAVRVALGVW